MNTNNQAAQRSNRPSRALTAAISAALSLAAAPAAHGAPQGGVVTQGDATISTPDLNLTQIDQGSHSASIDWQSFDVAAQERVIFNQPSASSVALNRILTQDPSQIHGSITANGRVFLINPNGIIFGASSRINVGSLVASSLDITEADAATGRYAFSTAADQSGAISNSGQIIAADGGSVTLLGGSVMNDGLIVADYGSVNLGAGRAATLHFDGDGLVRFQVDGGLLSNASGAGAAVDNTGEILADGGQVLLTASAANDVIARAVNNDGVIRAARVDNTGGRIRLVGPEGTVVNNGTLDATGVGAASSGGEVQVLGDRVELTGTSLVDVSGSAGGGTALIGGSFRGEDPAVLNAQRTDVQAGAVIKADSTLSGDAGRVAVWADGTTVFHGDILARATGSEGNGGYAEISGKEHLGVGGDIRLESTSGAAGTLLLDPGTVTITSGGDTAPPASLDTFNDGWINARLATLNLIIETNASTNNGTENLIVDGTANISWSSINSLTLIGDASVSLAAGSSITNAGAGALILQSGGSIAIGGTISLLGDLTATAGSGITQTAALSIGGISSFTGGVGQSISLGNTGNSFAGAVNFASGGPGNLLNVTVSDSTALDLQALAIGGNLNVTADSITQSGALIVAGTSSFTADAGQSVVLGNTGNSFTGAVSFASAGPGNLLNVTVSDSTALDLQALTIGGNLTVAADSITQSGALTVTGTSSFTANAGESVVLDDTGNSFTGALNFASAGAGSLQSVNVYDATALALQTLSLSGDLTVNALAITQTGALNVGGAASFTAAGGQSVALGDTGNVFSGAVSFASRNSTSLQDVTVYDSAALDLQALSVGGNLTVNAGSITQSGAVTVAGIASFTAGQGQSILLGDTGNSFAGTVGFASRGSGNLQNLTVYDATALDLQALSLDGNLSVNAGSITQSGALNIVGTTSLTAGAGQSVVLGDAGNLFGGAVSFASRSGNLQNITVRDSTALELQAIDINGNLAVTAQAITQSGALIVDGTSGFTVSGNQSITLNNTGNAFSGVVTVASSGGNLQNVALYDSTALDLQALSISGNLTVNADLITQSGALDIGGASSFTADAGQSLVLDNAGNGFDGAVSFASRGPANLQNVTVRNSTAIDLQALAIAGNLNVVAGGAIGQSGALAVGGTSSFTAAAGQSIVLTNAGNSFTGAVSFVSGGPGNLQNVTVRDSTALDLQALTLDGNLGVTAAGAITQSGALIIGGTSSFAATAGQSILLGNAGNSFAGAVSLATSGAGNLQNVTLRDLTSLDLQALTINGDLNIVAGGAISQSGSLNVAGAASFRTLNDPGAAITLAGVNSFGSVQAAVRNAADTTNAAASVFIEESNDTLLGDMQTGAGQSVSVRSAGSIAALANTSITTSSVSLAAAGDIGSSSASVSLATSSGRIGAESSGSVYLTNTSGVGSVALDRVVAGNAGTISFVSDGDIQVADVRAGDSVSLTSTNGNIVDDNVAGAGSQLVTGNLTLLAAGAIGQAPGVGNGALDLQTGSVSATAQAGGVYLDETGGDINIRQISAAGPVRIQAATGSILDDAADATAASITSTTGGVQLRARDNIGTVTDVRTRQGTPIAINTNGGALSAQVGSAAGQINLNIASGSNPTAAAAAISAGGAGRLLIQSPGDLSLTSFNAAIAGFSEVGFSADGTLQVSGRQSDLIAGPLTTLLLRGGNDIAQADRVFELSANQLVFESGGQGGNVTLNTNVDLLDATIGNGASLTVVEGGDITLGSITAGGDVSIRAANIFDDGDVNAVTRITAGNSLSLQGSAGIGRADGTSGGRIDTAGNTLSVLAAAGPVFISHLGDLQVSGEAQGGLIDIVASTGSITLSGLLGASESLALTASGTIADAGDAATYLSARDANLTASLIGTQGNRLNIDVSSLNASAANGLYLNVANAVQLRSLTAQEVVINAAGNITDDGDAQTRIAAGNLTLSGSAIGAAGAGNEIDTSVDRLAATATAGGIYIGELGNIELAAVNANGASNEVTIVAAGAITDDGDNATRIAGGNLTLRATAIGAAGANGELDTQGASLTASASSGDIYIGEADDLQLNAVTAGIGGSTVIAAAGALTDDGNDATRVSGENVTLTGSRIGAAGNRVDTAAAALSATATDGGVHIDEQDSVTLTDVRSSGSGNEVDLRTGGNGSITVQDLTTQGGAVNLAAGGTGSLTVTGAIASNNGVVNLIAGNALAVPGLSTGTGTVVLRTVNDLNVGSITAGSISITSDTGNISLGTVNAGAGVASITANNGTISDGIATSLTAGQATLSARSIGSADNPLNIAVGTLTATTSAGGVFVEEADGLTVAGINSAGRVSLAAGGAVIQSGAITSAGNAIALLADSIDMLATATTDSTGGDITYVANNGDATLGILNAGAGRVLAIAADDVFSSLGATSGVNNITASAVEIRAGGLGAGLGEIGTDSNPLAISTPAGGRSVFLVVPLLNGIQTSTPRINYTGPTSSILLKGYSGTSGTLLFDRSNAFTSDTVLGSGESIVPLLNGRIAINSDSLRAARQALSSGVVSTVSVDWAAFDPDVSLFGTLDPPLRLPADQIDEAAGL